MNNTADPLRQSLASLAGQLRADTLRQLRADLGTRTAEVVEGYLTEFSNVLRELLDELRDQADALAADLAEQRREIDILREQVKAPAVHVTVPAEAIKLELPPPRRTVTEKNIVYDRATGLPATVIETTRDEPLDGKQELSTP